MKIGPKKELWYLVCCGNYFLVSESSYNKLEESITYATKYDKLEAAKKYAEEVGGKVIKVTRNTEYSDA